MAKQSKGFWGNGVCPTHALAFLQGRFGDWAHSFPCFRRNGKTSLGKKPDRSLSLKQPELHAPAGKTFASFAPLQAISRDQKKRAGKA
jgi:hypothetical protein